MNNGNYSPWGKLNLVLGAVAGVGLTIFVYYFNAYSHNISRMDTAYIVFGLAGLASAVILFIRNKKLDNIGKTIGITLLQIVLGVIIGFITIFRFGWSIYRGTSYESMNLPFANNSNPNNGDSNSYSKTEDAAARAVGYKDAADYENRTGFSARNIDPDEVLK